MSLALQAIPVYSNTPWTAGANITNGTGAGTLGSDTNGVTIYTAPTAGTTAITQGNGTTSSGTISIYPVTGGARCSCLIFSTTDTAANNVFLYIKQAGGTVMPIAQINVPLSSGNLASTLTVNGLNSAVFVGLPRDAFGNPYIPMQSGDILKASVVAAVTSGKTLYITATGESYL